MFDIPLFPSMDCLCRKNCSCRNSDCRRDQCRGDEYIVRVCGCDSNGNLIIAVRRR